MKIQWMTAALLGAALLVGCGDRGDDNARNLEQNNAPANEATDQSVTPPPAAATPAPSSTVDAPSAAATAASGSTARNRTQPSTSTRANSTAAPAPRVTAAPRPEPAPARPVIRMVSVPAGTALPLELTTALSTETAKVEMPVSARLRQDVVVNGQTAFPAGAVFHGEVIDVERPGRVQGRARLGLRFTSVTIGESREDLRTNPVTFEGEASKGEDATKVGAGAGIGAVIGGIVGGGSGAAKGAAIGGAAGTGAVLATRGKDVALAAGTDINATLASEIEVRAR